MQVELLLTNSAFKSLGKALNIRIALRGIFRQGLENDLFKRRRNRRTAHLQRGRRGIEMLGGYFSHRAIKGTFTTEPFVHDHSKRILVACSTRLSFQLLG